MRNPERLNLDRRNLFICPRLEEEENLRLLNYQNNNISAISNVENLPQLIFLDFYNNNLRSLDGPLEFVSGEKDLGLSNSRLLFYYFSILYVRVCIWYLLIIFCGNGCVIHVNREMFI